MPVVNYTNSCNTTLAKFVASFDEPRNGIKKLYHSTFETVLNQQGLNLIEPCFASEQGDQNRGFALVFLELPIGMIGIVLDYRENGVSQDILSAGIGNVPSIEIPEIYLEVHKNNSPAVRLDTSIEFKTIEERHWLEGVLPGSLNPER